MEFCLFVCVDAFQAKMQLDPQPYLDMGLCPRTSMLRLVDAEQFIVY
jgi:hypothetical protein